MAKEYTIVEVGEALGLSPGFAYDLVRFLESRGLAKNVGLAKAAKGGVSIYTFEPNTPELMAALLKKL